MPRTLPRTLLALSFLAACETTPPPEPLDLSFAQVAGLDDEAMYEDFSTAGDLTVVGEHEDFTLTVGLDGGSVDVFVHTAAQSDLALLDGRAVQVELLQFGFSEERSLILSDDDGLAYALDAGWSLAEVNSALGSPRLALGEAYAADKDRTWDWSFPTLQVTHDDGVAVLLPGDVVELSFDGVLWRVAALTLYEREARPNASMPGCPVLDDLLSYELLRLEAPQGETVLAPIEGALELGHLGCG